MGFFNNMMETAEEEAARLVQAPEGSDNHELSKLPVNISHITEGMIIELPKTRADEPRMVVAVVADRGGRHRRAEGEKSRRFDGSWAVVVVASENPSYRIGGYQLSIPTARLVRGTRITV